MLFVTFLAPHFLAMLEAAPLLPASFAVPVSVATPPLTVAEKPCGLRAVQAASLSVIHFCIAPSSIGAALSTVMSLAMLFGPQLLATLEAAPLLPMFLSLIHISEPTR